jgi:hypothetical protein|tara:strand:- start:472 stop:711 length:240 start_codon:yes stop_codon:yes gene_type:complete
MTDRDDFLNRKDLLRLEALRLAVTGTSTSGVLNFTSQANRYYDWLVSEATFSSEGSEAIQPIQPKRRGRPPKEDRQALA